MGDDSLTKLILLLQNPAPQYVFGCLPAIATIGAAPESGLTNKILWLLRCLGCPFTGLFYSFNVNNNSIARSAYWLTSDQFLKNGNKIPYRPVGHHAMEIVVSEQQDDVIKLLEGCVAESSALDRLSSLVSAYYIFIGIFIGLVRINSCSVEGWPYLPFALAWTLPAIYDRVLGGKLVVKDPRDRLKEMHVVVRDLPYNRKSAQDTQVLITFVLFSVIIPWTSVILSCVTFPKGYGCRSKYLTVLCSIWSFNSIIAYKSHIRGEKFVSSNRFINVWFCLCGIIIAILLILLGLLNHSPSWWVDLFGETCEIECDTT
ncbi:hypothetical protein C1645_781141 [Glomus cerebriforme]|uniref:Uncharacterized protein n=1 Tax=Glomus cerebriforme TaxID=658196 RepID=A0A397SJI9_9GLOM|nr:hypothetical protein C1645_781141 [Glomus cerebriforme]